MTYFVDVCVWLNVRRMGACRLKILHFLAATNGRIAPRATWIHGIVYQLSIDRIWKRWSEVHATGGGEWVSMQFAQTQHIEYHIESKKYFNFSLWMNILIHFRMCRMIDKISNCCYSSRCHIPVLINCTLAPPFHIRFNSINFTKFPFQIISFGSWLQCSKKKNDRSEFLTNSHEHFNDNGRHRKWKSRIVALQ